MEHGTTVKTKIHSVPSVDGNSPANMNASSGFGSAANPNPNPNMNSASTSNTSTSASTTLNSGMNLNASTGATAVAHSTASSNSYPSSPAAQSTNRGKKFSWVKRLMNNNNVIAAEPTPLAHTRGNRQHRQNDGQEQPYRQTRPRAQKKGRKDAAETSKLKPKPAADKDADRDNTVLRKPAVYEHNAGKIFQFNDVTSIENDEMVSYVSSNASLKLQDSYDRQFYMRQDGYDANTIASVKSIFSVNPAPSIYSTGAVSTNTSGTNNNNSNSNRSSFAPAQLSHINHMHPVAHSHGHNYNHLNTNPNPNTHNHSTPLLHQNNGTSYNNYLDSASAFSGSVAEDNVSTKPLVSFSSDEEEDCDNDGSQLDYSDDFHAHKPKHASGHHVQIADDDRNTRTWKNSDANNSEEFLAESITTTGTNGDDKGGGGGDHVDDDDTDRTHRASNIDRYIQLNDESKEHYKRHDDSDQSSFDVKSKYPSSTKSAAVTSMSILTSPMLTTINSSTTTATTMTNNTTNTNVATAASVMTLASSSRHVYNV